MRELEFLPDWYKVVRRRRLAVIVQVWATVALLLVLLVWTGICRFRVLTSRNELGQLKKQMAATQLDLDHLDQLNQMKRRWTEQGEVLAKLGVSVDSTRLISLLAENTPESVSLTNLNFSTEEKLAQPTSVAAAKAMKGPNIDRRLLVRVQGVSPTGAEVVDLIGKLSSVEFLQDVAMTYTRPSEQGGRVAQEFEVTFAMDLNAAN